MNSLFIRKARRKATSKSNIFYEGRSPQEKILNPAFHDDITDSFYQFIVVTIVQGRLISYAEHVSINLSIRPHRATSWDSSPNWARPQSVCGLEYGPIWSTSEMHRLFQRFLGKVYTQNSRGAEFLLFFSMITTEPSSCNVIYHFLFHLTDECA